MSMFRTCTLLALSLAVSTPFANAQNNPAKAAAPKAAASQGSVTLAEKGVARSVIVVPKNWMEEVVLPDGLPARAVGIMKSRQTLFRDSVADLALYLGKMSGAKLEVVTALPANDKRLPIYIGAAAQSVFGPVGITRSGLYGFRVVVDRKRGVGLYGESEAGSSYAIYELLHNMGCRWFMPTDLGEVVPNLPTLSAPVMDAKLAPATSVRHPYSGGADFARRNRLGPWPGVGPVVWLAEGDGSMDRYFTPDDLKAHPEWTYKHQIRITHPGVADHIAKKIIAELDKAYEPMKKVGLRPGYSLVPPDGQVLTEDPEERKHDPEPRVWEGAAGRWSVTDRLMVMHNRIANEVRAKYPDVMFGDQAYVNKSLPPAKEPVPKDFRIVICPIDFNRYHPMDYPNHINEYWLRDLVEGWNKKGAKINAYWYAINLAEISAPCPFIAKWSADLKILLDNNVEEWGPEYMNGWESMMPAYYMSIRMMFHKDEKPDEILNDLWTKFYGPAAKPMAAYWMGIDKAYIDAREWSGSPYGYLKIFTPEVMKAARQNLDESLKVVKTPLEYRRVKLIDESFELFELYMKMRNDWAKGNVAPMADDYQTWRWGVRNMQRQYKVPMSGGRYTENAYTGDGYIQGRHGNPSWSDVMYSVGYKDGSRMEKEYTRVGTPMLDWKWQHNPKPEAESLPWTAVDFDDKEWKTTNVVRDTWSSLGHHYSLTDEASGRSGRMAYRASQTLPAITAGKKVYLWLGSTDGSSKLFVNGTQVKYVNAKGETVDAFTGYSAAGKFDITAAVKAGKNQFTLLCERTSLNELGTGGLLGPVIVYRDK